MKEEILEIIKGHNKEKEILSINLSSLSGENKNIPLRSSIERRLEQIDKELANLSKQYV